MQSRLAHWLRAIDISLKASAAGTLPYLLANVAQIAMHDGRFLHFSKGEAAVFTVFIALMIWVVAAALLTLCTGCIKGRAFAAIALPAFAVIGTAMEPNMWRWFLDPLGNGFGYWLFVTGAVATPLALALRRNVRT